MSTWAALLVLLILVAAPLLAVLINAVTGYRGEPSALGNLADPAMVRIIANTVWLSFLVVVFTTLFAAPLAFLRSWTQFSKIEWLELLIMVPFMTPPFAVAMAWMDFTRVRGLTYMLLGPAAGEVVHDFIYSVWGMAFVMAAELFPFLYLIMRNSLRSIPASLIEMAEVSGASKLRILVKVILPMVVGPYSLGALIVFIKAAGEFGTPITLGNAIGYQVLVSSIYEDVTIAPLNFSEAAASSSVLFTLGVTAWAFQQWVSRKDLTSGGRLSRPIHLRLRGLQALCGWLTIATITALSVFIPYISITLSAMTILRSKPPSPYNLTFDYFGKVLSHPIARDALTTSAILGALAATCTAFLAVVITLSSFKRRSPSARVTDFLSVAPDTVPGIVLAIGFILLWNNPDLPWSPYGTYFILLLAYTTLFLPTAIQNVKTSAAAIPNSLRDAGAVSGATTWHILWRITLPLMAPGIFAGWLLAFLVGIRELVMSSLVRPTNINLMSPWIMNAFEQGDRAEAMAMTLIGVGSSTIVMVALLAWQAHRNHRLSALTSA
ncbi:iron ABC transporter permease [Corynebacterium incognita]|uniref:Iron ABC transporter permease n=2 Tax=Corynebacterium incognita TaxID=2754725 RepID=A0A7G7CS80_9CORY|nr:iron ABC transporter permease [Corynebacterium incognita]